MNNFKFFFYYIYIQVRLFDVLSIFNIFQSILMKLINDILLKSKLIILTYVKENFKKINNWNYFMGRIRLHYP